MSAPVLPIVKVECLYRVCRPDGTEIGTYPSFLVEGMGPYAMTFPDGQQVTCKAYSLECRGVGSTAYGYRKTFAKGKVKREGPEEMNAPVEPEAQGGLDL
jgi:hypothetical protein